MHDDDEAPIGVPYTGYPPRLPVGPPTPIIGYRELGEDERRAMNAVKRKGEEVALLLTAVGAMSGVDPRAVAEAETCLKTGFMWLNRAIARPTTF